MNWQKQEQAKRSSSNEHSLRQPTLLCLAGLDPYSESMEGDKLETEPAADVPVEAGTAQPDDHSQDGEDAAAPADAAATAEATAASPKNTEESVAPSDGAERGTGADGTGGEAKDSQEEVDASRPELPRHVFAENEELVTEEEYDRLISVVIVGAGLSGLSAAYQLTKERLPDERQFMVLEANDRIGGRSFSAEMTTGVGKKRFDLGGQWVTTAQKEVIALAEELGMPTNKQYTQGRKILMQADGTLKTYTSSIPPLNTVGLGKMALLLKELDSMAEKIPAGRPHDCEEAKKWDRHTLETFMQKHKKKFSHKELSLLLDTSNRVIFGAETQAMSLLGFLYTCRSAGGYLKLAETTEGSAQEMVLTDCSHGICMRLAEEIGEDRIVLSDPVVSIEQGFKMTKNVIFPNFENFVKVRTQSGKLYKTRGVIITIPPQFYNHIQFKPPLSASMAVGSCHRPMGHLVKWIATYETAFWRTAGYSGEIVALSHPDIEVPFEDDPFSITPAGWEDGLPPRQDEPTGCMPPFSRRRRRSEKKKPVNETPLGVVFDNCKEDESGLHAALVGLAGGKQAAYQSSLKEADLKQQVLADLVKCFGEEAGKPLDFVIKDWYKEPHVGGCPVSNYSVGGVTTYPAHHYFRTGRVVWAGTDTSPTWRGYLDGAVSTGRSAATRMARSQRPY